MYRRLCAAQRLYLLLYIVGLWICESFALCFVHGVGIMTVSANTDTVRVTAVAFAMMDTLLCRTVDLQIRIRHVVTVHIGVRNPLHLAYKGSTAGVIAVFRLRSLHVNVRQAAAMIAVVGAVFHITF